jgi:hypothetical protein
VLHALDRLTAPAAEDGRARNGTAHPALQP